MSTLLLSLNLILFISSSIAWSFWEEEKLCTPTDIECYGEKLYSLYEKYIFPIEKKTYFNKLVSPSLTKSHFTNTKPIISLIGQYSSGKTTFVNLLIGGKYPHQHTSIAASTSKFMFINGVNDTCGDSYNTHVTEPDDQDGEYFVMDSNTPFNIYQYFSGTKVIESIKAIFVDAIFLNNAAFIIDTPGISSSTAMTSCDFIKFYDTLYFQSNLIIFMFDPHKPSDLLSAITIFKLLKNSLNKVRFVVNKADSVPYKDLLDVIGAIQYNLGRAQIFESLEINKLFITSLWNKTCSSRDSALCEIIQNNKKELLKQINDLKNERAIIQSKIKSLSSRMMSIKRHIHKIKNIALKLCSCCWFWCSCNKNNDDDDKKETDDNTCYTEETNEFIYNMYKQENWKKIKELQNLQINDLNTLEKAQQQLNEMASS